MRKIFTAAVMAAALSAILTTSAGAEFSYNFSAVDNTDFLPSTDYEDLYGAQYNYGGRNVIDFNVPELTYGKFTTTQPGIMEKAMLPGLQESVLGYGITSLLPDTPSYGVVTAGGSPGYSIAESSSGYASFSQPAPSDNMQIRTVQFTQLSEDFKLSNGAIGSISIPALDVYDMYVWEGENNDSMSKGLGHFISSSVWDGNVALCGHNRGASYIIGGIKDMSIGDSVYYTTSAGQRTYRVETITTIPNDDWTYLKSTSDNRITLVTCVAGDYSQRWCLQAVEV